MFEIEEVTSTCRRCYRTFDSLGNFCPACLESYPDLRYLDTGTVLKWISGIGEMRCEVLSISHKYNYPYVDVRNVDTNKRHVVNAADLVPIN